MHCFPQCTYLRTLLYTIGFTNVYMSLYIFVCENSERKICAFHQELMINKKQNEKTDAGSALRFKLQKQIV
jgi:hypothetical protein